MKKFTLLFSLLLLCLGATQLKAEKRIRSIGTNIPTADAIVDGGYYILKQVYFNKCMYESATTGQILAGNQPTAGSYDSWSFIWQAHAEEDGKVSFTAPSGKYIPYPNGDVYTVAANNRDKFTVSAYTGNANGNWQVKSSLGGNYWDCNGGGSFTGWGSGTNIEYQIIPVEVEESMYTTVATLPTTSTTDVVTGYYMLKQVNTHSDAAGGGWIKAVNMAVGGKVTTTADVPVGSTNSMAYLWYVEKNADNTISISTYGKEASWKVNKQRVASMSAYGDKASFTLHSEAVSLGSHNNTTPVAGSFLLSTMVEENGTDVQTMVHNSAGNMGSWDDANPNSLYNVEFYLMNESALSEGTKSEYTVTYIYKMEGASSTKTTTITAEANSTPAAPQIAYYHVNSLDKTDAITCDVAVNVSGREEGLPFEKTTDLSNPKWYAMLMHQNTNNDAFVQYTALSTNLTADKTFADIDTYQQTDKAQTLLSGDGYWWCFKGNVIDGFEIYNKAAGTDGTKKLAYGNGNPQVRENPANYTWYISKSNEGGNSNDWTCFAKNGSGNIYLNKQETTVAYWNARDNGSSIKFYAPTDLVNINLAQLQQYLAVPDGAAYGSKYVESHRAELTAASDASAKFNTETALNLINYAEAYNTSIANGELNEGVVAGKYYRLKNVHYNTYMVAGSAVSTTDNVFGGESAENIDRKVGTIVQFVADGDNYKLYVQGKALGKCTMSVPVTLTETENNMGVYELSQTAGVCTLKDTKTTENAGYAYLHSAATDYDKIVGWESGASASQWYIIPVTSVEVALNNVGDANYASLCLPFAVEGDGNTKLYTGTINGNELVMAEQTAVPANTGVVLKGAAATTTLNIVDNADAIGSNSLQGTCRPVASTGKLVLGVGNESGTIGFYVPSATLTELAANKAYLNVSDVSAASGAIAMNFGGEATGIGAVLGEEGIESNAPVFDLSGRRVMQTVKGGLYIQNGKKFIVK